MPATEYDKYAFSPGKGRFLFFLFALVAVVYGNTLTAGWHLDDYPNITHNPNLDTAITDFESFQSGIRYLGKTSRPVARSTFLLNHIFNGEDVFGYHIVNIAIHLCSAFILFLAICSLCESPRLSHISPKQAGIIAFISAAIWAVHPIQTQAVTYIVQRMASLAALFYILSIYFYLKARLTERSNIFRAILILLCVFCFLLGMGSKENVITLPFALMLIEFIFFKNPGDPKVQKQFVLLFIFAGILILFASSVMYLGKNPLSLFQKSGSRYFTPVERLMTEPRVIFMYLSQIIYPIAGRFSIEHDIELSRSLFSPRETLPSIMVVLLLIGYGLSQSKKRPILAFGILFFFLAHSVESTFLNLEIVFEHRNYLPTMFLFFPIGIAWVKANRRYQHNVFLNAGLHAVLCLAIFFLGVNTYLRNEVWATEKSLLEDASKKAPDSGRIYHSLAWAHYEKIGRYDIALKLYKKALESKMNRKTYKALVLNNAGAIHYQFGNYKIAADLLKSALAIKPDFPKARYLLASSLAFEGLEEEALNHLNILFEKIPDNSDALNLKGFILFHRERPEEALDLWRSGIQSDAFNPDIMANVGSAFFQIGKYDKALVFFNAGRRLFPEDHAFLLHLIATHVMRGDMHEAEQYSEKILSETPASELNSLFDIFNNRHIIKPERSLVYASICSAAEKTLNSLFMESCL